jgi:integrase
MSSSEVSARIIKPQSDLKSLQCNSLYCFEFGAIEATSLRSKDNHWNSASQASVNLGNSEKPETHPFFSDENHTGKQTDGSSARHRNRFVRRRYGMSLKHKAKVRVLHGLRQVFASMPASSGQVDMYTLQKLLTHKSPIMTQRYAYLRDESLKRPSALAGELVNKFVPGTETESKKTG